MSSPFHRTRVRLPLALLGAAAAAGWPAARAAASIDVRLLDSRTSNDWNTASNWNTAAVPTANDDVYVSPNTPPYMVTLSADAVARSLTISASGALDTAAHRLDVTNSIRLLNNGLKIGPDSLVAAASLSLAESYPGQLTLAGGAARFANLVNNTYSTIAGTGTLEITNTTFPNGGTNWVNAGQLTVSAGTLTINTAVPWRSTGPITLIDGSALAGSQATIAGRLNVQGAAAITAPVRFDTTANVALSTTAGPSILSLSGPITYAGGQYSIPTGAMIRQNNDADVIVSTGITGDRYDWDGTSDNQTTNIHPGASFGVAVKHIQDAGPDVFRGTINITNGGLNVTAPWEMAGTLNLLNDPNAKSPTSGPLITGATLTVTGAVRTTNTAAIYAPVRLVGATVVVADPADTLAIVAPTEFHGGSYTGQGQFSFASDVTVTAGTTIAANVGFTAGRTITVGPVDTSTLALSGGFAIPAGATLTKRGPGKLDASGPQSHGLDATIKVEAGTLRLATDAGSPALRSLNLAVGGAGSPATAVLPVTQHLRSLRIDAGGQVTVSGTRLVTESLSIDTAAVALTQLDLGSGTLIVDYAPTAPASPLADVRAYIGSAYHAGAWDGPGITSSAARTNPARTLGYGEAADVLHLSADQTAPFADETVAATTVLVRFTAPGDATLDGAVNFDDLLALAKNYNTPAAAHWFQGDFNYDGTVNFDDLLLLAKNYNAAVPAAPVPGAPAIFAADLAAAFSAVPEPGAAALTLVVASSLLGRRRRPMR